MRTVSLEELLEAGSHFGHQVTRHNPRSRDFVFEARDGIHIIDLAKTKEGLEDAARFIKSIAEKGGSAVLVGTKKQAEGIVRESVKRAREAGTESIYYVTNRWIGGTFTNFSEVAKNFRRLEDLTNKLKDKNVQAGYTKKEISLWEKERQKLESFYGGIKDMTKIPDVIYIVDTHMEDIAVREARQTHVKTVGITDTNSDPTLIDYPIPANDDAVGSVELITNYIVDAFIEGFKKGTKGTEETDGTEEKAVKEKTTESAPKKAEVKETPVKKETTTEEKPKKAAKTA